MKFVKMALVASLLVGSVTIASAADARHWHRHHMCGWGHHHHHHCWWR